jgi:DnaK suppressor protein
MKKALGSMASVEKQRKLLLAKRSDLLSSLSVKLESLVEPGGAALEDQAPVFHDQFVALQLNRLDSIQLRLVEDALAKLGGDEYGVCVDCERTIPGRRLKAIPWATRCVACQEELGSERETVQVFQMAT